MASNSSPDYKALYLQAVERQKQAEEEREQVKEELEQAVGRQNQAEEEARRERERNQRTTFEELIRNCHNCFSRPLKAEAPSLSTKGTIPQPKGKCCPTRFLPWTDCSNTHDAIYSAVHRYLWGKREFTSREVLVELGRLLTRRPISSEQDLESYERLAVEDHVNDIISELCKIPAARDEFGLGDGVRFDNHANAIDENLDGGSESREPSSLRHSRPDQFCIHRIDGDTTALLTTVEYKPPHKLSVENLRVGIRPMNVWEELVKPNTIPTDEAEKLKYNAERLSMAAVVQEYHVMIQEGLEFSYLTNGFVLILLYVPLDDPSTLYYHYCEPNMEIVEEDEQSFRQPRTAIARVLCLCLMSFRSIPRDQSWRNAALNGLNKWTTSFDYTHSQIPDEELRKNPPNSDYTGSDHSSSEHTGSEFLPSSSPTESPTAPGRRIPTRSQAGCGPSDVMQHAGSMDSSDSDSNQASSSRKRGFSQVTSSPPTQRSAREANSRSDRGGPTQRHVAQFCTQRCLRGLQQGGQLDEQCPNVKLHRQGRDDFQHLIDVPTLVRLLKQQLDTTLDSNCTPCGERGGFGAPFKITCAQYGYTVLGKGTTSRYWKEVSREAEVYGVLQKAQGSAVPVFLGKIDLKMIYFLHGAGQIRHMLLMAWGGVSTAKLNRDDRLLREISRSTMEIVNLGVMHLDLRPENILWNEKLRRAQIIDFHQSEMIPVAKRALKRRSTYGTEARAAKRLRGY